MQISLQPESLTTADANLASDPGALAYRLFSHDKLAEFAAVGLPQQQAEMLVQMQWRGRNLTYAQQYPDSEDWVISIDDGLPIGRYSLQKTLQGFRMVDLAILPEYRNRGIGSQVLQQLTRDIAATKKIFALRVEKDNPALRLYTRLGFTAIDEDELSYEMVAAQLKQ
jgi:ribosomal protein S18 acetylase RimI-like enzyme